MRRRLKLQKNLFKLYIQDKNYQSLPSPPKEMAIVGDDRVGKKGSIVRVLGPGGPGTNVAPEGFKIGLPVGKKVRNEVGSGLLGEIARAARIGVGIWAWRNGIGWGQ